MSELKVNSIKGVSASSAAIAIHNSDGTCTLASGSKLNNCTTDGTTNLTIADGNLVVGTDGHGIDFSATGGGTGTGTSELLADYEEGTFTPAMTGGVSGSNISYTSREGRYTKIGNVVYFTFHILFASVTLDSSAVKFGGLPYTSASAGENTSGAAYETLTTGNLPEDCTFRVNQSDTQIIAISAAGDAIAGNTTSLNIAGRRVALAGFYYV